MYENEHMSPPNFPAGSCSSFPVRASVCFQPVSPCDVRLPPLLSRQPQLPAKIPPPVCSWATWLFHKGYWNNSAPRRKWQSVQKSHSIALGGWYSLEQWETFYHCMDCSTSDSHTTIIFMSYCSIDSETVNSLLWELLYLHIQYLQSRWLSLWSDRSENEWIFSPQKQ